MRKSPLCCSFVTGKAVRVRFIGPGTNKPARYRVTISDGKQLGKTYSRHDPLLDSLNAGDACAAAAALHYVNEVLEWNVSLTGGMYNGDWYFTSYQGVRQ